MANRLAGETSPYLLQHAHNPVDWYPWGPDALAARQAAGPADLPEHRLRGLPLVSRDGARIVRARADGAVPERPLRLDQGRPRGAARPRPGLHGGRPGDDRRRRLADVGLPDPGRPAVLRRHVLPGRAPPRDAVVPPGARGCRPGVAGGACRGRGGGRAAGGGPRRPGPARGRAGRSHGRSRSTPRRPPSRRRSTAAQRRLGPRAEVPAADDDRVPAAPARRDRGSAAARWSLVDRSTRWPMAGSTTSSAAGSTATRPTPQWLVPHFEQMLYDNAQLARVYVHAWSLTGDARYREVATGHARLHAPRADDRGRRVRREPGRRHRRRSRA